MHSAENRPLRSRQYRRLSDDRGGTSIADQGFENTEAAIQRGWTEGSAYVDPDNSAGPGAKKKRPDYDQLVSDLKSGNFDADVLQMWEGSRGSRRATQWSEIIELCKGANVYIFITSYGDNGRLFDLSVWEDEKTLLQDAISHQDEWHRIQKRNKRTVRTSNRTGRPRGTVPFGYIARYDPDTGKLINWFVDESPIEGTEENPVTGTWTYAEVVRQLLILLERGYTLTAIEKQYAKIGIVDRRGVPLERQRLRWIALNVTYLGKRKSNGTVVDGTWDAIVPEERHNNVKAILLDPSRDTSKHGQARHLLTGTLACCKCDAYVGVALRSTTTSGSCYRCINNHVLALEELVDGFVVGVMLEYLSRPDVYEALVDRPNVGPEVKRVREKISELRAELIENESAADSTTQTAAILMLANARDKITSEIKRLESREMELALPPAISNFLAIGDNVRASWNRAPFTAKRQLAKALLTPEYVGRPVLLGGHKGVPIEHRIGWRRKE